MSSQSEKNEAFGSSEFQENLETLRQIAFFSALPLESLKLFAYISNRETFKPGDYLFRQDEDDGQGIFILKGNVEILRADDHGDHPVKELGEGSFIGGLSLMGPMRRLFSMKALDDVSCMMFERDKFQPVLKQFPDIVPKMIKSLVTDIYFWEEKLLGSRTEGCEACMHKVGVSLI